MRKIFFFFIFLPFTSFSQNYYISNQIGSVGSIILNESDLASYDYYIKIFYDKTKETRVLYEKGKEYKKWIINLDLSGRIKSEDEYSSGSLFIRKIYKDGFLSSLSYYSKGELFYKEEYSYNNSKIAKNKVYDGKSNLLYEILYLYSISGDLRKIIKKSKDFDLSFSKYYFYENGMLKKEFVGTQSDDIESNYDSEGRSTKISYLLENGKYLVLTEYEYEGDSRFFKNGVKTKKEGDKVVEFNYFTNDDQGRLSKETYKDENGFVLKEIFYNYLKDGSLALASVLTKSKDEDNLVKNIYEGDELLRKEIYINDVVQSIENYKDNVKEVYRNGDLVLRIYYDENGQDIKEESISNHEVVGVRKFGEN